MDHLFLRQSITGEEIDLTIKQLFSGNGPTVHRHNVGDRPNDFRFASEVSRSIRHSCYEVHGKRLRGVHNVAHMCVRVVCGIREHVVHMLERRLRQVLGIPWLHKDSQVHNKVMQQQEPVHSKELPLPEPKQQVLKRREPKQQELVYSKEPELDNTLELVLDNMLVLEQDNTQQEPVHSNVVRDGKQCGTVELDDNGLEM